MLAAAAGGAAALAAAHAAKQPTVEEDEVDDVEDRLTPDMRRRDEIDREATPTSPAAFRDEGYVTDAHNRSTGAITPRQDHYGKDDLEEFNRAMDAQDLGEDCLLYTSPSPRD